MSTDTLQDLSLADLNRLVRERMDKVKSLQKKRERILSQLAEVEEQIEEITGPDSSDGRAGTRARNPQPLKDYVKDAVGRTKKGLPLDTIMERVLAAGYQSKSSNFRNTLYQCLYNNDEFVRDDDGNYTLK